MFRTSLRACLGVAAVGSTLLLTSPAEAGRTSFSFGIGYSSGGYCGPRYYSSYRYYRPYCGPTFYYPPVYRTVYVAPAPVYYSPPVVYSQPTVVYQQPAPVVYSAPSQTTVYTSPAPNTAQNVVYSPPPSTSATAVNAPQVSPPAQPSVDGWTLLSTDQARTALDAFALEAERSPSAGLPKVGYALAAAVIGDDAKAAWAMRQALQVEPDALNRVQLSTSGHNAIRSAINRYDQRITSGFSRADDLFMVAALRYVEADYANADAAIAKAMNLQDTNATTTTLKTLLDVKMGRNWKYNYTDGQSTSPTPAVTPAAPTPVKPQ